jgi:MEDS: MEthanogen/methylotroph, DcmR Sensory domain
MVNQKPRPPHDHAVQFYADPAELFERVGTFLSEGLAAGQPAIVIATPEHGVAIERALEAHLIDVAHARRLGDLVMLDAEETLGTFMVDHAPVGSLFRRSIGAVIEQALRGRERTPVRAYGEMVDVLWKQGRTEAAIRVEVLWNNLADSHAFSLLCGYAIGNFYKQNDKYREVCDLHSHVHRAEANA